MPRLDLPRLVFPFGTPRFPLCARIGAPAVANVKLALFQLTSMSSTEATERCCRLMYSNVATVVERSHVTAVPM